MNLGSRELSRVTEQVVEDASMEPLPSFTWELTTERFWWSAGLCGLHGFGPGEIEPSLDLLLEHQHPDDRDLARQAFERIRRDGQPFVFEHRLVTRNGDVRTVVLSVRASGESSGPPQMLTGTLIDVTTVRRIPGASEEPAIAVRAEWERLAARAESQDLIGQATGVLMERYKLPAEEAYALLRRSSQLAGRKLVRVASDLLFTGSLPTERTAGRVRLITPDDRRS
jgi:hypothetical protein